MASQLRAESRYDPERKAVGVFWVLACCKCGAEGAIRRTNVKNTREGADERIVAERLRREGWEVGNNLKSPVCPTCVAARAVKRVAPEQSLRVLYPAASQGAVEVEKNISIVPKADPPRQPTPADRRRIVSKMDEAYNTQVGGYLKGFSDEKVAESLAVPLAWVRDVREMMYGPAVPAEVAALQPDIRRMEARIKDAEAGIQRWTTEVATMKADLASLKSKVGMADPAAA